MEPIEKPSDIDEDEDQLIELELSDLEEPYEQPIELSDGENEPYPPKEINKNIIKPQ